MPEGSVEYHINIIHRQPSLLQTPLCQAYRRRAAGAHDCYAAWHWMEELQHSGTLTLPRKMAGCQFLAWLARTNYDAWTWNLPPLYPRQGLTAYIAHTVTKCGGIVVLSDPLASGCMCQQFVVYCENFQQLSVQRLDLATICWNKTLLWGLFFVGLNISLNSSDRFTAVLVWDYENSFIRPSRINISTT